MTINQSENIKRALKNGPDLVEFVEVYSVQNAIASLFSVLAPSRSLWEEDQAVGSTGTELLMTWRRLWKRIDGSEIPFLRSKNMDLQSLTH